MPDLPARCAFVAQPFRQDERPALDQPARSWTCGAASSPVLLGRGEALFEGMDLPSLGYRATEVVPTELATHLVLTR
jgi:hypothetical protein